MAFKMKGAPMHDTSSKHGTNANYKKSGAPGLLGKILDPLGLKNKIMGGNKGNCPPQQQQVVGGPKPVEPVTPTGAAAGATDPVVDPNAGVSGAGGTPVQMKGDVKIGPAESPEAIKKKRQAYNEVPLGKEYDAEYDKKRAAYKDAKAYEKKAAPMKDSPMRGDTWDSIKGKAKKAYDKASQVGMGVRKAVGTMGMYQGTYDTPPTGIGKRLGKLKKAYVRGRDTEERVDKRGGGKGTYKGGRSDEKAFMEKHAKNWRKKDVDVYGKGKEAQRIANEKEDARGRRVAKSQYNKGAK